MRVAHLVVHAEEDLHVASLQVLIVRALVDLAELAAPICPPLEFLGLIGGHDTRVALEGTTAEHKAHPFNQLILHEAEVFLLHGGKDLPNFVCQHFTHKRENLSKHEVFVDKEKEETFGDRFLLNEPETGVGSTVL